MKFYCTRFLLRPAILALVLSSSSWASDMPDPTLTPGAINPYVTQANIHQTVCMKGYTKTIRPPTHFTNKLKKRQIREYGYADRNPKHYEEDHLDVYKRQLRNKIPTATCARRITSLFCASTKGRRSASTSLHFGHSAFTRSFITKAFCTARSKAMTGARRAIRRYTPLTLSLIHI